MGSANDYVLAMADGAYRFEMTFQCPDAQGLVLHNGLLVDGPPEQINYATVQVGTSKPSLVLFTRARRDISVPGVGPPGAEGPASFARQGLTRVLGDLSALALAAGLLVVSRRWADLARVALALAIGYAAAFAISLGGSVAPDLRLAKAAMAAAAGILGLCALCLEVMERRPSRAWNAAGLVGGAVFAAALFALCALKGYGGGLVGAGVVGAGVALGWLSSTRASLRPLAMAPAALFGLLDGTGWAQGLSPLQMPGPRLASALFGYDLGAFHGAGSPSWRRGWRCCGWALRKLRAPRSRRRGLCGPPSFSL